MQTVQQYMDESLRRCRKTDLAATHAGRSLPGYDGPIVVGCPMGRKDGHYVGIHEIRIQDASLSLATERPSSSRFSSPRILSYTQLGILTALAPRPLAARWNYNFRTRPLQRTPILRQRSSDNSLCKSSPSSGRKNTRVESRFKSEERGPRLRTKCGRSLATGTGLRQRRLTTPV